MKLHTRIISLFLSFWMLAVSSGFSLSFHYCGDKLENWSILKTAEACEHHNHDESEMSCHKKEAEPKSCCRKVTQETKVQENCCKSSTKQALLKEDFNITNLSFSIPVFITFIRLFVLPQQIRTNLAFEGYFKGIKESPPILIDNIPVFIQSFLI